MRLAKVTVGVLMLLVMASSAGLSEETIRDSRLNTLTESVTRIATKHFPECTSHQFGNHIHFEQATQLFIVPSIVKSLDAEEIPQEEIRGPMSGGVWCRIELREGMTPYARSEGKINRGKFDEYLFYPYSNRLDCHLYVTLRLPSGQNEATRAALLAEFRKAIRDFASLIDRPATDSDRN